MRQSVPKHARPPDAEVLSTIEKVAYSLQALAPALLELKADITAQLTDIGNKVDNMAIKLDSCSLKATQKRDSVPQCTHRVHAERDTSIMENVLDDLSSRYAKKTMALLTVPSLPFRRPTLPSMAPDPTNSFLLKRQAYLQAAGASEPRAPE